MTKEQIQDRMKLLEDEQSKAKQNLTQNQASVIALEGAIQDCNYWLQQLSPPETPVEAEKE